VAPCRCVEFLWRSTAPQEMESLARPLMQRSCKPRRPKHCLIAVEASCNCPTYHCMGQTAAREPALWCCLPGSTTCVRPGDKPSCSETAPLQPGCGYPRAASTPAERLTNSATNTPLWATAAKMRSAMQIAQAAVLSQPSGAHQCRAQNWARYFAACRPSAGRFCAR